MQRSDENTRDLQLLLEVAADGDPRVYDEVIAAASERLLGLTRKMLRRYPSVRRWEQTDDVFQGAVMRLYRSLREVKPLNVRMFFGLATTQIRRTLIDLARHYYGPQGHGTQHHSDGGLNGSSAAFTDQADRAARPETLEAWAGFHEAVDTIAGQDREVFQLVWYGGMQQKEVAALLGVSIPTVKRRLHRRAARPSARHCKMNFRSLRSDPDMTDEDRVGDLLIEWDDARALGRELTPEELCHDCPALVEDVRQGISGTEGHRLDV